MSSKLLAMRADPTILKLAEIYRTQSGQFFFVCTYCDSVWNSSHILKKHINSHFEKEELNNGSTFGPLLASPEFVSIADLKLKTEQKTDNTTIELKLQFNDVSDDETIKTNGQNFRLDRTQSTDESLSSAATNISPIVKREPGIPEKIDAEGRTHSTDETGSLQKTKVVKIVKLRRVKLNPRFVAMKKKMLIEANSSKGPASLENNKATIAVKAAIDDPHPRLNDSVHLQSCYQCEMEPTTNDPSDKRRHKCLYCPIWFPNHFYFDAHVATVHTKDPNHPDSMVDQEFYCYICEQSFPLRSNLVSHLDRHKDPQIFLCSVCGSTHKTKGRLVEHMKIHDDGPKIECDECGKVFRRFSSLRQHFWLHETEPSFACTVCSKAFKMKRYLDRHMAVHEDPKFQCRHCDTKFHFVTVRTAHERSRHKNV